MGHIEMKENLQNAEEMCENHEKRLANCVRDL
jgi:hypothetical protein